MQQRIGSCSICGGDVMGVRGAWYSVAPPPPDKCASCGAVSRNDVIPMVPPPTRLKGPNNAPWMPTWQKPTLES